MHKLNQKILTGGLAICFALSGILSPSAMAAVSMLQSAQSTSSICGLDQYETAAKIAQNGWPGTSEHAILAAGMPANLIDALAAGPLAAKLNSPILLSQGIGLNKHAKDELTRLNVKTVYVTSGSAVIKQSVIDEIKAIASVTEVKILGGYDASQTSVNIAKEMENLGEKIDKIVVTGGAGSDALSIAPIAGAQGMPILYSGRDSLSKDVFTYFEGIKANLTKTYVIGGTAVISDDLKAQLPGSVERYSGQTQYDTNIEVLKQFSGVLKNKVTYVANGETLVDALAGVPLAVQNNSPILLIGKTMTNASLKYAQSNLSPNAIGLGGEAVVPGNILAQLAPSEIISLDGSSKGSSDASNLEQFNGVLKVTGNNVTIKNAKTDYSIYVQGDNVTLNNLIVRGTIFLDPGDNGSATLDNVNATNIVILSGAEHSIRLMDVIAALLNVHSNSPNVHIDATGATRFEQTQSSSSAIFEASDGSSFGAIRITYSSQTTGGVPVVELIGTFPDSIEVGGGVTVIAAPGSNITNLIVAPDDPDQTVTLQGNFLSVEVNRQANVILGDNTTVDRVVTNAAANIEVPSSSEISNLDRGTTETTTTGDGSIGGNEAPGGSNNNRSSNTVPVSGISVAPATLTLTVGGATGTITSTVTPNNATNSNVSWSSSDITVATVVGGVVTPVAAGTATITVTSVADGTKTATTAVTVNAAAVTPTISTLTTTKDEVTITFSENIVSISLPNSITFASGTYDFDVYQDTGTDTLFRLGHYGLLEQTANSMTIAILGSWGDLSTETYDFKLYTGDFLAPTIIAQSNDFSFSPWNGINTDVNPFMFDSSEIWVTVENTDAPELMEGLINAEFGLFDGAGNEVDFDFEAGPDYDPMIPAHESRITPTVGVFEGVYRLRFAKAGYNPDNAMFTVPAPTSPLASYTPVTLTQTGDVASNDVQYADAAAVIAALPTEIAVTLEDASVVNVTLTWVDTDTYDAGTAGDYTFTATWGAMPAGANDANGLAVPTVEVTVAAGI